jgi:hypothetical protein
VPRAGDAGLPFGCISTGADVPDEVPGIASDAVPAGVPTGLAGRAQDTAIDTIDAAARRLMHAMHGPALDRFIVV